MRTYNTSYMLYLSEEQKEFIARKAKEMGVSSAQYCRMLIQQKMNAEKGIESPMLNEATT